MKSIELNGAGQLLLAASLRAAGSDGFVDELLATLDGAASVDHCIVVEVGGKDSVVWGSSARRACHALDASTEGSYCTHMLGEPAVREYLSRSELLRKKAVVCIDTIDGTSNRVGNADLPGRGFGETFIIVSSRGKTAMMLGLYRCADNGTFTDAEKCSISAIADVLAALVEIHIRLCVTRTVPREIESAWKEVLSERERAVARLLARGETARTTAALLGVATTSVITYKKRAFEKLGVSRQCELAALVGCLN